MTTSRLGAERRVSWWAGALGGAVLAAGLFGCNLTQKNPDHCAVAGCPTGQVCTIATGICEAPDGGGTDSGDGGAGDGGGGDGGACPMGPDPTLVDDLTDPVLAAPYNGIFLPEMGDPWIVGDGGILRLSRSGTPRLELLNLAVEKPVMAVCGTGPLVAFVSQAGKLLQVQRGAPLGNASTSVTGLSARALACISVGVNSQQALVVGGGASQGSIGGTFKAVTLPDEPNGATATRNGASALSLDHIYIVGEGGRILFWNSSKWTPVPTRAKTSWNAVFTLSATFTVAVGEAGTVAVLDSGRVVRELPEPSRPETKLTDNFLGVWAASERDVWIVGKSGAGGSLVRLDGACYRRLTLPASGQKPLRAVAGLADANGFAQEVWMVGDSVILKWTGARPL